MGSGKTSSQPADKVPSAPCMRGKAGTLAAAAVLAGCFAWLSFAGALRESATFDESFNIVSGLSLRQAGRLAAAQPNPPLLLRWLALPLPTAEKLKPFDEAAYLAGPRTYGFNFIYSNTAEPGVLLNRSRAANVFLGLLLALLTGFWAFRLGGRAAGISALFLFAFMPPLLAHAHMATGDIGNALLCTALLYLLWRGGRSPSGPAALAAGLACGLALSGKYTAGLLVPLALVYLYTWGGRRLKLYACFAAGGLAGLWLGCWPVSPRDWLLTGLAVSRELGAGHITYVLGKVSGEGSWQYFPLALLLKTPLPALLLAGAGLYRFKPLGREGRDPFFYLVLPSGAWLLLGIFSNTQVGIRHLLPVYPLLCAWGGLAAARLWQTGKPWLRAAVPLLFVWQAAGTLSSAPWHLSYFNELAAGQGYRWLLDSNLDWGQGLKELGAYSKAAGAEHIYLSYFGCADPHAYGLKYAPVLMTSCSKLSGDGLPPPRQVKQLLAVSANNRFGVYYTPHNLFGWLDGRRPVKIAGNSIWVYDVTGDTEALKLLSFPGLAQ